MRSAAVGKRLSPRAANRKFFSPYFPGSEPWAGLGRIKFLTEIQPFAGRRRGTGRTGALTNPASVRVADLVLLTDLFAGGERGGYVLAAAARGSIATHRVCVPRCLNFISGLHLGMRI